MERSHKAQVESVYYPQMLSDSPGVWGENGVEDSLTLCPQYLCHLHADQPAASCTPYHAASSDSATR
jgi:hypothetical protein